MSNDELPSATLQDLLEFFWAEPLVDDTVSMYSVTDARGVELQFSFDEVAASIQTLVLLNGEALANVSHEQLVRLRIYGDTLVAECRGADCVSKLELRVRPQIAVQWSSLRTL